MYIRLVHLYVLMTSFSVQLAISSIHKGFHFMNTRLFVFYINKTLFYGSLVFSIRLDFGIKINHAIIVDNKFIPKSFVILFFMIEQPCGTT